MRILTESEINQLCAEMLEKSEQQLMEAQNRKAERLASFQNIQEKQYQGSLQAYQRQLAYYEQALKTYEDNIAREEVEYPKRVKAWEENEELRKRLLEQSYTQSVAAYEQSKQQHEAAGLPFHMSYPKKMEFRPTPQPRKRVFQKPIDVFVFNCYALRDVVHDIFANTPDILSDSDIDAVAGVLRQFCADDPAANPNYKEKRSYYSAYSKLDEPPNASYQHKKHHRPFKPYFPAYDDDYDDSFDDYDD
jgi:hypothetical protein